MALEKGNLDKIIAAAKKRSGGADNIVGGDEMVQSKRLKSKQSIELNLATVGGIPWGRMTRMWGGKSSCKTMSAWGFACQAQEEGYDVVYHNIEGTYDLAYTRDKMGMIVTKPRLIVSNGGIIEDVSRNLDSLLHEAEVHIVDSASYAQSRHGADPAKKDSRQPGFDSQAWKMAYESAERNMDKESNIIIIIDQERTDFKTAAAKAAGGKVPEHASSMTLRHRHGKKLYRTAGGGWTDTRPEKGNDPLTGTHRIDGYEVEIEVEKNKVGRRGGKALLRFDIDSCLFDEKWELTKSGIFLGVIEQSGSFFKVPTTDKSLHGAAKLDAHLDENPYLRMMIHEAADEWCAKEQVR